MGNVKNVHDDLSEIFTSVQVNSGSHQKNVLKLLKFTKEVDCKLFLDEFKTITNRLLICDTHLKNPYVERCLEFIALFCRNLKQSYDAETEDEGTEHEFLVGYMQFLLERQNLNHIIVRLRTCQLINKILDQLVGTALNTELCDEIEEALFSRLKDPKLELRLEGIKALQRFQEKCNPLDRIINMFKILMEQDRFAKVRCLCTEKIALRQDVVSLILSKIRDVDTNVKLAAFKRLMMIPGGLKIEQRRLLLKSASLDSSDKIKNFVESVLLPKWFQYYDYNFHAFMKAIRLDGNDADVEETEKLCEFILRTLFKSKPLEELIKAVGVDEKFKLIPYEDLNWETANYWRILVQYIRKNSIFDEEINEILPELIYFCRYINQFCEDIPKVESTTDFLKNQFILKQLFTITKGYDLSDPIGRSALQNLVRNVLSNIILVQDTVKVILSNLEPIIPNLEKRASFINELISEIRSPDDTEDIKHEELYLNDLNKLKNDYVATSKKQEAAIKLKDYDLAGELQNELDELSRNITALENEESMRQNKPSQPVKQDKATLIKILDIAAGFLLSPVVTKINLSLEMLKGDIFELLIHEDEAVHSKALLCYGLFCVIDKKTASAGIHLLFAPISTYQNGQECDLQVLLTCIGAVVDLLRIYGTELIASPDDAAPDLSESQTEDHQNAFYGGTSLTKIIQCLVDLMEDEEILVREASGRGLCSLLLSNTIQSPSLMSRIMLKWCNPCEASDKLKQLIGMTLHELPRINGFHQQWEKSMVFTLKALVYGSTHTEIKPEDIAKFMLSLYEANAEDHNTLLLNFAMRLCSEMRNKPQAKQVLTLSKVLIMLKIVKDNPIIEDLLGICDELQDLCRNRIVRNNLIKFVALLNKIRGNVLQNSRSSDDSSDEEEGSDNE